MNYRKLIGTVAASAAIAPSIFLAAGAQAAPTPTVPKPVPTVITTPTMAPRTIPSQQTQTQASPTYNSPPPTYSPPSTYSPPPTTERTVATATTAAPTTTPDEPTRTVPSTHAATTSAAPTTLAPTSEAPTSVSEPSASARVSTPGAAESTVPPTKQAPTSSEAMGPTSIPSLTSQLPSASTRGSGARTSATMTSPTAVSAPSSAVQQARNATPTTVNAAKPPPVQVDFGQRVQQVIQINNSFTVNINNRVVLRPRRWNYLDYSYGVPYFYNPCSGPVYVRYFYSGAYQTLYVPIGGRIVLDVGIGAVYPYTVVGPDFLASGSFYGGGYVPPVWNNVEVFLPTYNQTVQVGQVTYIGHDASRPAGEQDSFMLDNSTLAWGTRTDDQHVVVTRTQTTPGVGAPDDGGSLIPQLAAQQKDSSSWGWWLGAAVLVAVIAGGVIFWIVKHPGGGAHARANGDAATDRWYTKHPR